ELSARVRSLYRHGDAGGCGSLRHRRGVRHPQFHPRVRAELRQRHRLAGRGHDQRRHARQRHDHPVAGAGDAGGGRGVTLSSGGAAGQEAALTGTSATSLQAEYQSVIDRYHVRSLDFDIEGLAVADQHSITLRDQALVGLKAANPGLIISYTLPVLPTGLTADGVNVLASAKHDGLAIDVVNIMAMDYGSAVDNGGQMGIDAIDAAIATEGQIAAL